MYNHTMKSLIDMQKLVLTICIGMMAYYAYNLVAPDERAIQRASPEQVDPSAPVQTSTVSDAANLPAVNTDNLNIEPSISAADVHNLIAWNNQTGYISKEDQLVYQGYSESVLESMVRNGDSRAATALGNLQVKLGDLSKAKFYYWQAAALGETASLGNLALLVEPASFTEMEVEKRREQIKEVMALLKLAELRGDLQTSRVVGSGVKTSYEASFGALLFDEIEKQQINNRASALYSDLQQTRNGYGLGEFNNEAPEIIKNDYSSQK